MRWGRGGDVDDCKVFYDWKNEVSWLWEFSRHWFGVQGLAS